MIAESSQSNQRTSANADSEPLVVEWVDKPGIVSDNEDSDEEGEVPVIQLGFVAPENEVLDDQEEPPFTTKLGGIPDWLCPDHIPTYEDVSCGICRLPLNFLMQIYTPENHPPEAYHRALYIFICSNGACHTKSRSQSIKVLRCQLPRENAYYKLDENCRSLHDKTAENESDTEEEERWVLNPTIDGASIRCRICGLHGSKRCSKCQKARYCSREHQLKDWNLGGHRSECGQGPCVPVAEGTSLTGWPPRFIDCEAEKSLEEMKESTSVQVEKLMENVSIKEPPPPPPSSNALMIPGDEKYENSAVEVDQAFLLFQRRIDFDPSQVIRYSRTKYDQESPEPLWVSDLGKPNPTDILPCQICGQNREFELQILPQLLNYIPVDHSSPTALDWGTYMIYTCPDNCWPSSTKDLIDQGNSDLILPGPNTASKADQPTPPFYLSEVAWHQDFSSQGIGENIRKNHFA